MVVYSNCGYSQHLGIPYQYFTLKIYLLLRQKQTYYPPSGKSIERQRRYLKYCQTLLYFGVSRIYYNFAFFLFYFFYFYVCLKFDLEWNI